MRATVKTTQTVDTALLRVAYDEWNPGAAPCVVLLHGWPDSPRCWSAVASELARKGWRVLAPALVTAELLRFLASGSA